MLRFVINLDSSKDRLTSISQRLKELGVSFERIPAVNGRALSEQQISEITYPYNHFESKVRFTRELTKGEVGCFLSHRKCWERLLESDHQWALIMEDDIQISSLARPYILSSEWIPSGVDICQLSCLKAIEHGRVLEETITLCENVSLVAPLAPTPLGTQCYLISRKVAQIALDLSERLPAPVDNFLFSPWFEIANKFTIWRTTPTLVIPNEEIDSDIGQRTKRVVKKAPFFVRHGVTRFLLDRKIRKYQRGGKEFTFTFK